MLFLLRALGAKKVCLRGREKEREREREREGEWGMRVRKTDREREAPLSVLGNNSARISSSFVAMLLPFRMCEEKRTACHVSWFDHKSRDHVRTDTVRE
eukprot:257169-Pelagomonas_calceolata.AAC.3